MRTYLRVCLPQERSMNSALIFLTTKTVKKGKIVSRMSVGPNTSKLRLEQVLHCANCAAHTLGPAGRSPFLSTAKQTTTWCQNSATKMGRLAEMQRKLLEVRVSLPQEKTRNTH